MLSLVTMVAMDTHVDHQPPASLHIRQLERWVKDRLRIRAAHNGRSMEAEARTILREALRGDQPTTGAALVQVIRRRFEPLGGVDLTLPPREQGREPPHFE
jgi:antitoxin FitA